MERPCFYCKHITMKTDIETSKIAIDFVKKYASIVIVISQGKQNITLSRMA